MKLETSVVLAVIVLSGNVACSGASEIGSQDQRRPTADEKVGEVAPALGVAIHGAAKSVSGTPLGGTSICLQAGPDLDFSTSVCTTSSEDGTWKLTGVPGNMDLSLAIEKDGFVPALWPISTGTNDIVLSTDDGILIPAAELTAPMAKGTGQIRFFARPPEDGTDDTIDVTAMNLDDPTAPAGVVAARANASDDGFVSGLPTGLYVLAYHAMSCHTVDDAHGYPLTRFDDLDTAHIVVPVIAGHLTTPVGMDCSGQ